MNLLEIDYQILKIFNQTLCPYLDLILLYVVYSVYMFLIIFAYYFLKKKDRKKLFHLIITSFIGYLLVLSLKFLINRPRPCETHKDINCVIRRSDPSFPSAHTFISFLLIHFIPKKPFKKFRNILYVYLALLIPFGSLYIGVHYPTDVLFGALIGIILPFLLSERISNKILMNLFKIS